jgi:hypothetical protein
MADSSITNGERAATAARSLFFRPVHFVLIVKIGRCIGKYNPSELSIRV